MTPLARLRTSLKLLNAVEAWDEDSGVGMPDDVLAWLNTAQGLIAVTLRDVMEMQRDTARITHLHFGNPERGRSHEHPSLPVL